MSAAQPLVTVVVATLDAERFLADALDSVRAQTYEHYEAVVVDGGSTDGTSAVAAAYPFVRWLLQPGRGFADAWNAGIAAARGEYVAFLDSDDAWLPRKLEAQVAALEARPALSYVLGHVRFVLEPGCEPPPAFRRELLDGTRAAPMPGTLLARRAVFGDVGVFGTTWSIASDIDWFARLKDRGLAHDVVPEAITVKRVHDRNLSYFAAGALNPELLRLLKDSLERRRSVS
jgi:glycosyltransferase involved in cell wall biosynthesis